MLNEKTSKELKEMAKELGIKGWWEMKKADLITAIEEAQKLTSEQLSISSDVNTNEKSENATEAENVAQEHASKKKSKREFTYEGKTQNLSNWAKELGMPVQTLYNRLIMKNWPVEKAFTEPVKKGKHHDNK